MHYFLGFWSIIFLNYAKIALDAKKHLNIILVKASIIALTFTAASLFIAATIFSKFCEEQSMSIFCIYIAFNNEFFYNLSASLSIGVFYA